MTTNTKLVINSAKLVKKLTHSTFFAPGTEKTKSLKKIEVFPAVINEQRIE